MDKKWIKLWYDALRSPRLATLRPEERWAWMCIILISSRGTVEGTLDPEMNIEYLASESHLRKKLISETMGKMKKKLEIMSDGSIKILSYAKYQPDWSRLKKYESQQSSYKEPTRNLQTIKNKEVDLDKDKDIINKAPKENPPLQVIEYLNKVKGTRYTLAAYSKKIKNILKHYTVDDCKILIDHQATLTGETNKKFFVPATIFRNMINFEERLMKAVKHKKEGGGKYDEAMERSRKKSLDKRHT